MFAIAGDRDNQRAHYCNDFILFIQEYYDFKANFTRIDFKSPPTGNMTIDNDVSPVTVVNDFGTGEY